MTRCSCRKNASSKLAQVLDAEKADGMLSEDFTSSSALTLAKVLDAGSVDGMLSEDFTSSSALTLAKVLDAGSVDGMLSQHSTSLSTLPPLPETVLCRCGVTHDDCGHMLQCDNCWSWSHSSCQGLSKNEAEEMTAFVCSACTAAFAEALEPHPPVRQADASAVEPLPLKESSEPPCCGEPC